MKKNEETRFYYFVPYKRNSRGYTRLLNSVSTLSGDKTILQYIQELMVIPEYNSVEFFEVFYRTSDDWTTLNYVDTFRVVDFDKFIIDIEKNLFIRGVSNE